jgi:cyclohexanecarboxylate-CoA ligase
MPNSFADHLLGQRTPLTDADVEEFRASGMWRDRTLRSVLSEVAAAYPNRTALVGYRSDGTITRVTYTEFDRESDYFSDILISLGIRQGDAVAVMLPNWVEYAEAIFGINGVGAMYVGIPVSYGEREVSAILRQSKAAALITCAEWRGISKLELSRSIREELARLKHVIVVGGDEGALKANEYHLSSFNEVRRQPRPMVRASGVCYLGFTSGTTGEPKGAMHTHETLLYCAEAFANHLGAESLGDPMIQLVASPLGHHTGYMWGVLFTVWMAGTGIYIDHWDPERGVEVVRAERCTAFFGAPTFLQDILRTDLAGDPDCPFESLVIAGSPVPRTLPAKAGAALSSYIAPAWGMTECGIVSSCSPLEPRNILETDGSIIDGSEVRILRADGLDAEIGEIGDLAVRGPSLFIGYYDRPDATDEAFLPGRWFRTGDTATIDEQGWLTLHGRRKDIIIRGGENIPVSEIETLLFDHPEIVNAALIGYPDDRLGERSCAVVVIRAGCKLDLAGLSSYLLGEGLSKHYLPERVCIVESLPTTQSGKIQKSVLRDMIANLGSQIR